MVLGMNSFLTVTSLIISLMFPLLQIAQLTQTVM
nr:MAG TPA: hypothetical protein [Caudoviricetes sp.]